MMHMLSIEVQFVIETHIYTHLHTYVMIFVFSSKGSNIVRITAPGRMHDTSFFPDGEAYICNCAVVAVPESKCEGTYQSEA